MNSCTETCTVFRTLCEDCEKVADMSVRYRLCEGRFARPQYYAEIVMDKERSAAYLGEDARLAEKIYTALVGGTVTPCTLQAVVEDFL